MNQKQRQYAANRIEEIMLSKIKLEKLISLESPTVQISNKTAKLKSFREIKEFIQNKQPHASIYVKNLYVCKTMTEEDMRKNTQTNERNNELKKRVREAIKKAQDSIILGSEEEALSAIREAENFNPH